MVHREVLPALFSWLSTKHRTIPVRAVDRVRIDHSWEGGSRDEYTCVNPETGAHLPMPALTDRFACTAFDHSLSGGYAATSPGVAYVRRSTFQGRIMPPCLELSQEDYDRLVTAKECCTVHDDCRANVEMGRDCFQRSGGIDPADAKKLATFRYKSAYRAKYFEREGGTIGDVERFIALGWLSRNKAGATALTPAGKVLASTVPF